MNEDCPELYLLALPAELPDRFRVTLPKFNPLAKDGLALAHAIGDLYAKTAKTHGFTLRADRGTGGDWHYEFYRQTP